MRRLGILLLLSFSLLTLSANQFQKGNAEFSKENYKEAEKHYKNDIATRGYSFNTLYNLGNLYLKENKPGLALSSFRKARVINPRSVKLTEEIKSLESELNLSPTKALLVSRKENYQITLTIVLFISTFVLLLSYFNYKNMDIFLTRHKLKFLIPLLIILGISITGNIYNQGLTKRGTIITGSDLLISPYPGSKVVFNFNEGEEIVVGEKFNSYIYITDNKSRYGWIESKSVEELWKK